MNLHRTLEGAVFALALAVATPASATTINLVASLDCAQAAAGAGTCGGGGSGTGNAAITFDDVTKLLSWNLTYGGLSASVTAAHFHGPAAPGVNAGIQQGIGTSNPAIGSATLSASQETDLLAGLWYINVHSAAFGGGEIRGQVLVPEPASLALLATSLLGFAIARRR